MATPKIKFETVEKLTDDPRNARKHSEDQVAHLAGLIGRLGWTRPIFVDVEDGNTIVMGHGARAAARLIYERDEDIYLAPGRERGGAKIPKGKVPIMDVSGWTPEERMAANVSDNRVAEMSSWDAGVLLEQMAVLAETEFEFSALGFDHDAMAAISREFDSSNQPPEEPEEEGEIEPPRVPVSRLGDMWVLGNHRIICGDSTDAETVQALLGDEKPHLMVTDPPYGVNYDPKWRKETKRPDGRPLSLGRVSMGEVDNDHQADWTEAWRLFHGDVCYVWHGGLHSA